jgi:hypothetical protein
MPQTYDAQFGGGLHHGEDKISGWIKLSEQKIE